MFALIDHGDESLWIIYGTIAVLFVWVCASVIRMGAAIFEARRAISSLRHASSEKWDPGELADSSSALVQSLATGIAEVRTRQGAEQASARFRYECEAETKRRVIRYRIAWSLVWIMPILGLIGAFWVGAEQVSSFAAFSRGSIDDVEAIRGQLPAVLAAFRLAFDTALVGLGAGLVAMVGMSIAQSQEESVLKELEEVGQQVLGSVTSPSAESASHRSTQVVSMLRSPDERTGGMERAGREAFWRAPWTAGGAALSAQALASDVETDEVEERDGAMSEPAVAEEVRAERASRNRWAIMWGFGVMFLGSAAAIVAGWFLDRVVIAPDFALVGLIVGATFWCMAALSEEP